MRKQIVILSILAVILIAGTASVNAATTALSLQTTDALECDTLVPSNQISDELERLRSELPNTFDKACQRIQVRYRFLLYTHDVSTSCGDSVVTVSSSEQIILANASGAFMVPKYSQDSTMDNSFGASIEMDIGLLSISSTRHAHMDNITYSRLIHQL